MTSPTQYPLGIGLLEQGGPELVVGGGVDKLQPAIEGGQSVVNDDVHPLAILPQLEVKHPRVLALLVRVVQGDDAVQQLLAAGGTQRAHCCQEPAVTCVTSAHTWQEGNTHSQSPRTSSNLHH